jgi:hypothetical protein
VGSSIVAVLVPVYSSDIRLASTKLAPKRVVSRCLKAVVKTPKCAGQASEAADCDQPSRETWQYIDCWISRESGFF